MPVHISDIMKTLQRMQERYWGIHLIVLSCMVLMREGIILNFRILT